MTAPDTLPPELAALGELLREDPPRPDPSWAAGLDARAAAGFPRPPRRSPWRRLRPRVLVPALGAVAAAAIALVVVLAQSPRGEVLSAPSAGSSVAPSVGTGGASSAAPAGSGEASPDPSSRSAGPS